MLVHSHEPAPDEGPEPRHWQPNWSVWRWVAIAGVVGFGALQAGGAIGTLLILVAFYAGCCSVSEAIPYGRGLTEWRQ